MSPLSRTPEMAAAPAPVPSIATARRVTERASRAAAVAAAWAERAGAGQPEAAEALRAAERAREWVARAAAATGTEEALGFARLAHAAAEQALEADRRTSAAIAADLWAAEDVRLEASLQPAA